MNNDENLDLLDLDDGAGLDTLPDAAPFAAPRPKKPWLLLGVGVLVIILATYIIVRTLGSDSSSSIDVDLDAPVVVDVPPVAPGDAPMPPMPAPDDNTPIVVPPMAPGAVPPPPPGAAIDPVDTNPGVPVRIIEDRKDVKFNPDAPAAKPAPVSKPAPIPAVKPKPKQTPKKAPTVAKGSWYVQFGSYSTRAAAESAQKKIRAEHPGLFQGRQFVILAAVMKDGSTKYRLRIAFSNANEANGFCRNAKSDGLDCYVAK